MKALLTGLFTLLFILSTSAQYPSYFAYNIENGAPSNEIYSILEDKKGYIWIGCDAGLYRFNGVNYEYFSSDDLTARSATGLIESPSGKIYGYNFNSQIFCVDGGQLKVIKDLKVSVNGVASDKKGNIWVSAMEGLYIIDDATLKWTFRDSKLHVKDPKGRSFTSNIRADEQGIIYYQNSDKLITSKDNIDKSNYIDAFFYLSPMLLAQAADIEWLFSLTAGKIYRKKGKDWVKYENETLVNLLRDRKVNSIQEIEKNLWINTYTGTIRFNPENEEIELFYPKIAFSDCHVDREGNFWFSTLHHGLIRFPTMAIRTWSRQTEAFDFEQFSHVAAAPENIYFANTIGQYSIIKNSNKNFISQIHEPQSDIGMLHYDPIDRCTYFNKINSIYKIADNGRVSEVNPHCRALKAMLHTDLGYLLLSSQGLYFLKNLQEPLSIENQLSEDWFRDIIASPFSNEYFLACNKGLVKLIKKGNSYAIGKIFLKDKQLLSVSSSVDQKLIYFVTYQGVVYTLNQHGDLVIFRKLRNGLRPTQIKYYKGHLFLATNKGILRIDVQTGKEKLLTSNDGLSSNNIRNIALQNDQIWAATGKGISLIPLESFDIENPRGRILKKGVLVNGKVYDDRNYLSHDDVLTILADGLSYRSFTDIQFAYRIPGHTDDWILVPASAGKLEIPYLPTGEITIELKMVDHHGRDSLNTLSYPLTVLPPFWQRWWFYVLIILFVGGSAYVIFRSRILQLRKKQQLALKQLHLENELRLTQQNALKAQMNPHFLFNVLNSIKGYIYENDKKNAARYLSDFSNLVRKVLELSSLPSVSLEREIEALKLYIDLEAMLLQSDFNYRIDIDENVDVSGIMVPALLIQPYVENAFKHGLRHKQGEKLLEIKISYDVLHGILIMVINDNGVGRKASEAINLQTRTEHQSFASEAMEKRLELLNHEKKGLVGVDIFDKFDSKGAPSGTTVTIRIHV